MKKLIFTLATALLFVANSFAQNAFAAFAALEHEGKLTTFTGGKALLQAVEAAEDGDVITLSAGAFSLESNFTIDKSITLRGAGIDVNDGKNYTTVERSYSLYINFDKTITLEGIDFQCTITNSGSDGNGQLNINKCFMGGQLCFINAKNVLIYSSIISNLTPGSNATSLKCYNSVISNDQYHGNTPYGTIYSNCVIYGGGYGTYEDCIITRDNSNRFQYSPANHCVYITNGNGYAPSSYHSDITIVEKLSDVFDFSVEDSKVNFTNVDFLRRENFACKIETVPQVGIYGGLMPFSPVLDLPSIKSITVAKQSDDEGKLSIDVEIED